MLVSLRFLGIANAAIWFGATVFFLVGVGPSFNSPEMGQILPRSHGPAAAYLVMKRLFALQYGCGLVALLHLAGEWLYTGRPSQRWVLYLVSVLLGLGLFGRFVLQPRLQRLHLDMYGIRSTEQQRVNAGRSIRIWRGFTQGCLVITALGLFVYTLQACASGPPPRFAGSGKFRG